MKRLTLLSGPAWPLGTRVRAWLDDQATYVPIEVLAPRSAAAEARFPGLVPAGDDELVAASDDGHVWRGDKAYIVLLWATRRWRPWSIRLSAAARLSNARRFVRGIAGGATGDADEPARPAGEPSFFVALFSTILLVATVVSWMVATVMARDAGLLVAFLAVCLFLAGGVRGFVAASAALAAGGALLLNLDPYRTGTLDGATWTFLIVIGVPTLLLLARFLKADARIPRRAAAPPPLPPRRPRPPPAATPPPLPTAAKREPENARRDTGPSA